MILWISKPYFSYVLRFFATLILLFILQYVILHCYFSGRALKSESNYFSTIGRIQAACREEADVFMLGSSLTGRLPDRIDGFQGVANLGSDGGSALDTLRAIDQGVLPKSRLIVIEANTLPWAIGQKPTEVQRSIGSLWFGVGVKLPCLSACARPSAFFYSRLIQHRIGDFNNYKNNSLNVTAIPYLPEFNVSCVYSNDEKLLIDELSSIFGRMKKNTKFCLVWLPPHRKNGGEIPCWISNMASKNDIPILDLGTHDSCKNVRLTDGAHMDANSASRAMNTILQSLRASGLINSH